MNNHRLRVLSILLIGLFNILSGCDRHLYRDVDVRGPWVEAEPAQPEHDTFIGGRT